MGGALEVVGLRRSYGSRTALDNLSFEVPTGRVVGFLGPNGAGKTTTMRAVFGLTDLDAGTVLWNGTPVDQRQRRRFGYMPEERGLYPGMLVGEQLEYLARLHGLTAPAARAATDTWLDRLEIADRRDSKVETLSHGNQQRVQLAAALMHSPELLVLDEPLSGLDPTGIDAIGQVLVDQAAAGCCVLFSSHQLDQVEDLCEQVIIIDHGTLVVSGTVDELVTSGARRLVVRVEGDRTADWAGQLRGVTSPRRLPARSGWYWKSSSTATTFSGPPWRPAESPSSVSSAAACLKCSGRRSHESRLHINRGSRGPHPASMDL